MKEAAEASLKRLGVDAIGLYQYHRPDPKVPWAESVGALADLLDEGKILMAGVSNATFAQIDEAQKVLGGRLVSVQNQFSPRFRSSEGELEHCEKLGIAFIPWSPLGGIGRADDIERTHPAFAAVAGGRRQPPAGHAGLDAGQGLAGDPDPREQPPGDGRRLGCGGRYHLTAEQVARLERVLISPGAGRSRPVRYRTVRPGGFHLRPARGPSAKSDTKDEGRDYRQESEFAMPAVTVPDTLVLPRITTPADAPDPPRQGRHRAPAGYEGEGFPVRRAFAGVPLAELDPFIHMDQMGEVEYAPGEPKGTPWHPHRGFETVTYMIDGTFQHQDSIGGGGLITNGSTQWMTAGAGILHIERPTEQLIASGGLFHGIQLWVNLPSADKLIDPRYQGIEGATSPAHDTRRRRARPRDRRRRRWTPRAGVYAHPDLAGARHDRARRRAVLPGPPSSTRSSTRCREAGRVGPDEQPIHTGQLAVLGPGDALALRADAHRSPVTLRSTCSSSAAGRSASPSTRTGPSS